MYWLPKMHKTPIGERFVAASKSCSTKSMSDVTSKVFNHVERLHRKILFHTWFKKVWAVGN